jgi:hypothetical protein
MTRNELHHLAERIEGAAALGGEEAAAVRRLISAACADRPVSGSAEGEGSGPTDAVLRLMAEALPSWSVHLSGSSATVAGRWTCTIRETGVRDDDELIGVGKALTPAGAIAAALLKVVGMRAAAG